MNQIITDIVVVTTEDGVIDIHAPEHTTLVEAIAPPYILVEVEELGGPPGPPGEKGEQGEAGTGFKILGTIPSHEYLPIDPSLNDAWITEDTDHMWVWNGEEWIDMGSTTGPQGVSTIIRGEVPTSSDLPNDAGLGDAYITQDTDHIWVNNGEELGWVDCGSIKGPQGEKGDTGERGPIGVDGEQGPQGEPGPTGGIGEAPNDGDYYARKDLGWAKFVVVTTNDTPPAGPKDGWLWWNSATAIMYVYYDDGSGSQWVQVGGSAGGGGGTIIEAPTDGQTYGRKSAGWSALPNITVGATAPTTPAVNDIWIDTT